MLMHDDQSQIGEFIYTLEIKVSMSYPDEAPSVKFKEPRIAMDAVDGSGNVNLTRLSPAFRWNPRMDIADALSAVRENMKDKKVQSASASLGGSSY
jgi:ubiquitin-protein ligase